MRHRGQVQSFEDLVRIRSVWRSGGYICQQEVFFPLQLALRVAGLNEDNHYSMDYELWGKFFLAGARVEYTGIPFGYFRWHKAQKTQESRKQTDSMLDAAASLVALADFLTPERKQELLADLQAYRAEYPELLWKQSGRLSRLGLPRSMVMASRHLRQTVANTVGHLTHSTRARLRPPGAVSRR